MPDLTTPDPLDLPSAGYAIVPYFEGWLVSLHGARIRVFPTIEEAKSFAFSHRRERLNPSLKRDIPGQGKLF